MRLLTLLLALCACLLSNPAKAQRILTLDWTLAETLVALGHPPAGLAQIADYHSWVGEPRMPSSTIELGLRSQPSMELMAELDPDLVLITPMFANMADRFEGIGPVSTMPLYDPDADVWEAIEEMTRLLGALTHREAAAQALIDDTAALLAASRVKAQACGPLLVLQFADDRHVRVYGGNSLYQQVLNRLDVPNAWTSPVNRWGYRLLALHELADVEGRVVVIEPAPLGTLERIKNNALWQRLPVVNGQPPIVLPPVWSLGGLPSAQRFARLLGEAECVP